MAFHNNNNRSVLTISLLLVHAQVIHNFKHTKLCIQDRGVADSSQAYPKSLGARKVFDGHYNNMVQLFQKAEKKSQIHAKSIKASYQQPTYIPAAAIFKAVEEEGKTGLTLHFRSSYLV